MRQHEVLQNLVCLKVRTELDRCKDLEKNRQGLRNKISPLLPREDYKISHVHQFSDMRECGQILKPRMSLHARFWVAPSGFRMKPTAVVATYLDGMNEFRSVMFTLFSICL